MSMLRMNTTNKLEFQNQSYQNLCNSVLKVEGNYIPAWYCKAINDHEKTDRIYLYGIDYNELNSNKKISVISTDLTGLTGSLGNGFLYHDKTPYTLDENKIYRLIVTTLTGVYYYSELFKKI